jgi:hypothetical protein
VAHSISQIIVTGFRARLGEGEERKEKTGSSEQFFCQEEPEPAGALPNDSWLGRQTQFK